MGKRVSPINGVGKTEEPGAKNNNEYLSYMIYRNQLKIDYKIEYKAPDSKTPRRKHEI